MTSNCLLASLPSRTEDFQGVKSKHFNDLVGRQSAGIFDNRICIKISFHNNTLASWMLLGLYQLTQWETNEYENKYISRRMLSY